MIVPYVIFSLQFFQAYHIMLNPNSKKKKKLHKPSKTEKFDGCKIKQQTPKIQNGLLANLIQ